MLFVSSKNLMGPTSGASHRNSFSRIVATAVTAFRLVSILTQFLNTPIGVSTSSIATTSKVLVVVAAPTSFSTVSVTISHVCPSGSAAGKLVTGGSQVASAMPYAPRSKAT